jgi:hypothetical protein
MFDPGLLDFKLLAEQGFTEIEIVSQGQAAKKIPLSDGGSVNNGRKLRVIIGYKLDDHDYAAMYRISSGISGCSGDKTLEKCISNMLIPFCEQDVNKVDVGANLRILVDVYGAEILEAANIKSNAEAHLSNLKQFIFLYMQIGGQTQLVTTGAEEKINAEQIAALAIKIAPLLTSDFLNLWRGFDKVLREKQNLTPKLPEIFSKTVFLHHLLEALAKNDVKLAMKILKPFEKDAQFIKGLMDQARPSRSGANANIKLFTFLYENCGELLLIGRSPVPVKEYYKDAYQNIKPSAPVAASASSVTTARRS